MSTLLHLRLGVRARIPSLRRHTHTSPPTPPSSPALPLWQRLGPLTTALQAYGRAARQRPWTTQIASTLVVYFCGDVCAQRMRGEGYEAARTGRALVIGVGSSVPTYLWFIRLGNSFNYASPFLSLATKVIVNQLLYTPIFNSYFFGMQALLSGQHSPLTWEGICGIGEHIARTVPTSFVNSCKLWPAVTAFSFAFVPVEFRSVFAGVVAVGWQTYLSLLNRRAEVEERGEEEAEKLGEKMGKVESARVQRSEGTA